jgi:hypothetical protein
MACRGSRIDEPGGSLVASSSDRDIIDLRESAKTMRSRVTAIRCASSSRTTCQIVKDGRSKAVLTSSWPIGLLMRLMNLFAGLSGADDGFARSVKRLLPKCVHYVTPRA